MKHNTEITSDAVPHTPLQGCWTWFIRRVLPLARTLHCTLTTRLLHSTSAATAKLLHIHRACTWIIRRVLPLARTLHCTLTTSGASKRTSCRTSVSSSTASWSWTCPAKPIQQSNNTTIQQYTEEDLNLIPLLQLQ